jgi:MbtH protein
MVSRTNQYKVVINHEEQYSIVPSGQTLSFDWKEVGKTGTSTECLKYIEEVWTDMKLSDKERILKIIGK